MSFVIRRVVSRCAAFLLVVILSGCPKLPLFSVPPDALKVEQGAAVCEEILASSPVSATLRALADVTVQYKDEKSSFRYAVVSKMPDRFRIDLLPPEGAFTLGMLVMDQQGGVILDAQQKTFTQGTDEEALTATFLGFRGLTRWVVLALLTGAPQRLQCSLVEILQIPGGALLLRDQSSRTVIKYDNFQRQVMAITGLDESAESVRYQAVRTVDAEGLPVIHVDIFDPARITVVMQVRRFALDVPVKDEVFATAIPAGYQLSQ